MNTYEALAEKDLRDIVPLLRSASTHELSHWGAQAAQEEYRSSRLPDSILMGELVRREIEKKLRARPNDDSHIVSSAISEVCKSGAGKQILEASPVRTKNTDASRQFKKRSAAIGALLHFSPNILYETNNLANLSVQLGTRLGAIRPPSRIPLKKDAIVAAAGGLLHRKQATTKGGSRETGLRIWCPICMSYRICESVNMSSDTESRRIRLHSKGDLVNAFVRHRHCHQCLTTFQTFEIAQLDLGHA